MFKKKRLFMAGVLLAAVCVGVRYGFDVALAGAALFAVLLAVLYAYRLATARGGFARLAKYRDQYGYDALLRGLDPKTGPFTFVVLGDSRNNVRVARRVYELAAGESPALIFNTGDIVRHGTAQEFVKNHIPLLAIADPAPVFCVPGNHERGARRDFAGFEALYGGDRFAFDYGPCRFVGFNNSKRAGVTADDLAFLDNALSETQAAHKFVFFHEPPAYFEERFVSDDRRRGFEKNADELRALLVRHNVNEVFMAHIHGYASEVIDGVRHTLTAGAGAPLSKRLPPDQRVYNYVVVHVEPDGPRREVRYVPA